MAGCIIATEWAHVRQRANHLKQRYQIVKCFYYLTVHIYLLIFFMIITAAEALTVL